jgi:hypothetical protein
MEEEFASGTLDPGRWTVTQENDFREAAVKVEPAGGTAYRLKLRADTLGTRDDTVKFLGVRSTESYDFSTGRAFSMVLDWNGQANGSYLTAGMFLSPNATDLNPQGGRDWLGVEYIGVPPGQNARLQVSRKFNGNLSMPYTEGWPDQQRKGRAITVQKLGILLDAAGLSVLENDAEIFRLAEHGLNFTRTYLYLQMSSHSNYPAREVYFSSIKVR